MVALVVVAVVTSAVPAVVVVWVVAAAPVSLLVVGRVPWAGSVAGSLLQGVGPSLSRLSVR